MAEGKVASLFVEFRATVNKFAGDMQQISNEVRRFDRILYPIAQRSQTIGLALSAGLTAPLLAASALVLKTGIDFETAFAGVRKTLGGSEEGLAKLRAELIQMSTQAPVTAVEFANIATQAAQLGIKAPDIKNFAQTMAELGAATKLSATDAANFLARFTNITQLPQSQIHNLASTLVALGNKFPAVEGEIANFGLRIAKVGTFVGLADADILAFAASLASVGVTAEAGGTAISRVFAEIAKAVESNGPRLQQFAAVSRVSVTEFAELFKKDAAGAVFEFVKGLQTIKTEGGPVFGTLDALKLSNVRVRDTLLALASGNDQVTKSLEIARGEFVKNSELTRVYGERNKTTASQITILKNQVEALGISLFDTLAPAINKTIIPAMQRLVDEGIKPVIEWFNKLPESSQHSVEGMLLFVGLIGPAILAINKLVGFFGGLAIILGKPITLFGSIAFILGEIGAAASLAAGATGLGGVIAALLLPLKVPWWLTAGTYVSLVIEIYNLAAAYRDLVTAQEEASRAKIGSDNAVFAAIADFKKRGINIPLVDSSGQAKSVETLRNQITELGLLQRAASKVAETMGVLQQQAAKATEKLGTAAPILTQEQINAATALAKAHQSLLEKFQSELTPFAMARSFSTASPTSLLKPFAIRGISPDAPFAA